MYIIYWRHVCNVTPLHHAAFMRVYITMQREIAATQYRHWWRWWWWCCCFSLCLSFSIYSFFFFLGRFPSNQPSSHVIIKPIHAHRVLKVNSFKTASVSLRLPDILWMTLTCQSSLQDLRAVGYSACDTLKASDSLHCTSTIIWNKILQ